MIRRYACCITVCFLLMATTLSQSSAAQRRSTRQVRATAFPAKPGFYIQFAMCHACAYVGWQKDTVSALSKAGVQAFVSDDPASGYGYYDTEQPYSTREGRPLRLRRVVTSRRVTEDWFKSLYAGPFDSEQAARQVFSHLPSTLKPALDAFIKSRAHLRHEEDVQWSRQLTDCSGNHCRLAGYSFELLRVLR